jgi:hypothetical protein
VTVTPSPGSPASPAGPAGPAGPQRVPYETDAPNAYRWTETAYDLLEGGKLTASIRSAGGISTATVSGECPYCRDNVNFSEVLDAVTGESTGTLGWQRAQPSQPDDSYVPLTVSCSCTELHAGRPADINYGCGINFRIEVRRDA